MPVREGHPGGAAPGHPQPSGGEHHGGHQVPHSVHDGPVPGGGYCQMRLARMLEEELGRKETEILYAREGSQMFYGKVREEAE